MTTAYRAWSIRRRGSSTDGKNDPARSFGIDRGDVAGLGRQQPGPRPVAIGDPRLGSLVPVGADHLGRLRLDQLLQHDPYRLADQVHAIPARNTSNNSDRADWDRAIGETSSVSTWPYTPRITPMASSRPEPPRYPKTPPLLGTLTTGSPPLLSGFAFRTHTNLLTRPARPALPGCDTGGACQRRTRL